MYHIPYNNNNLFIKKAFHAKYGKAPSSIDFASYKKKLNFTASAVGSLEDLYKKKKLLINLLLQQPKIRLSSIVLRHQDFIIYVYNNCQI